MAQEKLFTYQQGGAEWLSQQKYALLADEMGLGKTAQAITAADMLAAKPILVLCPAVARTNWANEFSKFSGRSLTCSVMLTTRDFWTPRSSDVTICSYDLATVDANRQELCRGSWSVCVLDEAHFLKNRKARRTEAVRRICNHADRVWALTGTPAPNNPAELWSLLNILGHTNKLDYWQFMRRYTKYRETPYGVQIYGAQRIDELKQHLAPIMLRRKKEDVLKDLPPITYGDIVVEATPVNKDRFSLYFTDYLVHMQDFERDLLRENALLEAVAAKMGLGANTKSLENDGLTVLQGLDKRVNNSRRWTGLLKVDKVIELVSQELEANAYQKIVLFAVHRAVIDELVFGLEKFKPVKIFGGTPPRKRDRAVVKFQTDPKHRVFVGQIVAAGTAINLTAAHHVMVVEADWTPANNAQAVMRCHRIGQGKPVTVRFVGLANSIDQHIQKVLKQKTRILTQLFDQPAREEIVKPVDIFAD